MMHADIIHKWLSDPASLPASERNNIKEVLSRYPYFIPARYLQAAIIEKEGVFTDVMHGTIRMYLGNWLLFHEMMQRSKGAAIPAPPPQQIVEQPVAETQLPVAEGPAVEEAPEQVAMPEPVLSGDALQDAVNTELKKEQDAGALIPQEPVVYTEQEEMKKDIMSEQPLIQPVYTEDYFRYEGVEVSEDIPADMDHQEETEADKSLLVMMSFAEWLSHFRTKAAKEKEEEEDKRALRSMWQKEKLAAALEEENDEIPETVFEMAVNSIEKEEGLVSESLAEILTKQKKYDKAIEMYRKLSRNNPAKAADYTARIEKINKEKSE